MKQKCALSRQFSCTHFHWNRTIILFVVADLPSKVFCRLMHNVNEILSNSIVYSLTCSKNCHRSYNRGNMGWSSSGTNFLPNSWRYKALAGYSGLWTLIQRFFSMKTQSPLRTIQILEKCFEFKMMLDYLVPGLFSTNAVSRAKMLID